MSKKKLSPEELSTVKQILTDASQGLKETLINVTSKILAVTEQNFPEDEHILMQDGFVFLVMGGEKPLWWVDKKHPHYPKILDAAFKRAQIVGHQKTIDTYYALKVELNNNGGTDA